MTVSAIITAIFDVVGAVVTGLGTTLTSLFALIWDSTATPAGLTELGTLLMIVVGAPIAWGLFMYVVSLIKSIRIHKKA